MALSDSARVRLQALLEPLYGEDAAACLERIATLSRRYESLQARPRQPWSERDVVLIAYGDQIRKEGEPPLRTLDAFLEQHRLDDVISGVHLLPFCPYSSDDGFSVIDYRRIDPALGDWDDVARLGESFRLMFDLVLNHCSQESKWFHSYLKREPPFDGYFIDVDPTTDLSQVTRPRSTPLLTPFETADGTRHVWTTFSADQVDLDFANPDVLLEMLDVFLHYLERGACCVRLDAVGFLWKTVGTTCMHLPQTHAVVKILRLLADELAPGTILITETNVPHVENLSYFGAGDEAHMVYQFSLPPLLLDAFLTGDAGALNRWLRELELPGAGRTFFNFTASHDGVGVRPLQGLVSEGRLAALVDAIRARGGRVSLRKNPDGSESPYELNITYFSALGPPEVRIDEAHVRRFLSTQGIMLSVCGIPGIYIHSLLGTENDQEGVQETGRPRTINRRKFGADELEEILGDPTSSQRQVFDGYREMLATRVAQPAFHPEADQRVLEPGHPALVAFTRTSLDGRQRIMVLANVSGEDVEVRKAELGVEVESDLLGGESLAGGETVRVPAWGLRWLV